MTRKPDPKREKRTWLPHRVHCRCDVALADALEAIDKIHNVAAYQCVRDGFSMDYSDIAKIAGAVLSKYGKKSSVAGCGDRVRVREDATKSSVEPDNPATDSSSTAPEPRRADVAEGNGVSLNTGSTRGGTRAPLNRPSYPNASAEMPTGAISSMRQNAGKKGGEPTSAVSPSSPKNRLGMKQQAGAAERVAPRLTANGNASLAHEEAAHNDFVSGGSYRG